MLQRFFQMHLWIQNERDLRVKDTDQFIAIVEERGYDVIKCTSSWFMSTSIDYKL